MRVSITSRINVVSDIDIKTHGSESRGQQEAACMHVFWPTRPLYVSYLHGWQL